MSAPTQSFQSHARVVPLYHYVANGLMIFPTLYFGYLAVTGLSIERLALFAFCVGACLIAFFARAFPLGVQDRVIRVEERLRMGRVFPSELQGRIEEFSAEQLIGLRFASDDELVTLARKVLDESISDRRTIKGAIKAWRPDELRI